MASGKRFVKHLPMDNPLREFIRIFGLVERVMQPYFARFGISGSQWGVLVNLYRSELKGCKGLPLRELSERLLIRPPSVTGLVDRLERSSLVRRVSSAKDLRVRLGRGLSRVPWQVADGVLEVRPCTCGARPAAARSAQPRGPRVAGGAVVLGSACLGGERFAAAADPSNLQSREHMSKLESNG